MSSVSIIRGAIGSAFYYRKTSFGGNGKGSTSILQWNDYSVIIDQAISTRGAGNNYVGPGEFFHCDITESLSWSSADQLALLGEVASSAKGHSFNLGVAAAQGGQTVKLVVDTAIRLAGAARALKKGRIDLALRQLGAPPKKKGRVRYDPAQLQHKDVSAMWLEIQYGWAPLLQDVHASATAYEVIANKPRMTTFTVRKTGKQSSFNRAPTGDPAVYMELTRERVSKQIIVELRETLSVSRSLGLQDPASIVWELVPFSFVADWFIPIGSYLEALAVVPFLNGRYLETFQNVKTSEQTGGGGYPFKDTYRGATGSGTHRRIVRTNLSSLPIPSPSFKPLPKAMSPGHVKNAVALLHQVFT